MFAWHYLTLCHVAINKASMIMAEGDQLLDAIVLASLAILLSSARVTHIHELLGCKVRVVITNPVAISAMVMVMVMVVGRPVVQPMP